jgi:vacuolar-type H+-ATPase subunit F/Vma7
MESTIRVISSPATGAGFQLAGIGPIEAETAAAGARSIEQTLGKPELGVLLVEEPIYAALNESERRAISRRPLPMVVPFPGPAWTVVSEKPEDFIAELLRQAIGYRVRLT